eukprot:TRINITY_DN25299_c0_g1_i1.p1 TRINITY_DN25299_c0_g1~~TRINITY_DN25299_c0_g1_i1.p1  ORF type:complete len:860 (+),score=224.94 TRINITY_DN25299_c0_g1_i1:55-2580(+)
MLRGVGRSAARAGYATAAVPDRARVVVVGGGIIGTSVAYHLAKAGWKDVTLLERDQLTSGTTWHAAGLMVTFGSKSETSTELRKYTKALYQSLEEETGLATGFKPCGFIELAADEGRLEEYRRIAAFNRRCGVDVREIAPEEVKALFPLCKTDDLLAGFYVADDGRVNPVDAAMALAKGARLHGATLVEGVTVTDLTTSQSPLGRPRVTGVQTACGRTIEAEYVVNCAGMWARQFGEASGITIPNQAAEHYYLVTEAMPEVDPSWPVIEDPANYAYIRPEGAGLMVGLFEAQAAAWNVGRVPDDFSFGVIEPDWERMGPYLEAAMGRVPATLEAGMKTFFCGPESFTPDLAPLVGEAPELRNYFVCAGMNSIGILSGGGMGRLLAHWIMHGKPDMDVTGMNIARAQPYQATPEYRRQRVTEALGMVYKCHYPEYSVATARNVKQSPLHERLKAAGAYFVDVSGWEGASWYAPSGVAPKIEALTWNRHSFHDYWAAEHAACREGVVLIDMSFMAKFYVQGGDAGKVLNRICTADVDGPVGSISYTQFLNDDGKMEGDNTVCKLARDKFLVVATDTQHRQTEAYLRRHIPDGAHAVVTDMSGALAQVNLQGPLSRALLQDVTSADLSNDAFPFRAAREIDIGCAKVLCVRMTYVGELGYELYVPTEQAVHVYDRLVEAGRAHGLRHAGLKALGSLRLEKAYRDFGHDMDNTDEITQVGLGFTCDFEKAGGFIGKEAVMRQRDGGVPRQRLVQVLCKDPAPFLFHGEVVWRDGKVVGDVRAGSYGHTLGGAVGLAFVEPVDPKQKVTKQWLETGTWELEIGARKYPARVSLRPMYDPSNARIKM